MPLLKYNYALIPKNSQQFIDFAALYAKDEKSLGQYQMHHALPHVTICHFEASENQLEAIWKALMKPSYSQHLSLHFRTLHTCLHDGKYWHLLIPDEMDTLNVMYNQSFIVLSKILQLKPKNYFPHLTLFDSAYLDREDVDYTLQKPLTDNFRIAITDRDFIGQSRNILIE